MKCVNLFAVFTVSICVVLASPLDDTPETRVVSLAAQNILKITSLNHVVAQQVTSYYAMSSTFFLMNANSFSPTCAATYNWFMQNYAVVLTQLYAINNALTIPFGASLVVGGPSGKKSVSDAMTTVINTLNQANQFNAAVNPIGASALTTKIQALVTLQGQINTGMSCANTYQALVVSCTDTPYTKISQFLDEAANIMTSITSGWCGAVTCDLSKCGTISTTTMVKCCSVV